MDDKGSEWARRNHKNKAISIVAKIFNVKLRSSGGSCKNKSIRNPCISNHFSFAITIRNSAVSTVSVSVAMLQNQDIYLDFRDNFKSKWNAHEFTG